MAKSMRVTLEQLHEQMKEGEVKDLNIILKTDVGGTAEVLSEMLQKLSTDKVRIRVISTNVGAITESDVLLASASNAIIIGFNVRPERNAAGAGRAGKNRYPAALDHLRAAGRDQEGHDGHARAGLQGSLQGPRRCSGSVPHLEGRDGGGLLRHRRHAYARRLLRVLRDNIVVYTGRVESLRRFKNDVSDVKQGFECGLVLSNFRDIKQGDVVEAYVMERVAPELGA